MRSSEAWSSCLAGGLGASGIGAAGETFIIVAVSMAGFVVVAAVGVATVSPSPMGAVPVPGSALGPTSPPESSGMLAAVSAMTWPTAIGGCGRAPGMGCCLAAWVLLS